MISGAGSPTPKAIFIIDQPTADDVKNGRAITGYTYKLISDFLVENHLNPKDFYYTAFFKEKVEIPEKKKDLEILYATALSENGYSFSKILSGEIRELQPFLLIPLGEIAFRYCTNLCGIRKYRGSILPSSQRITETCESYKVLPILGPNPYLNQEYWLKAITRMDFTKVPQYLNVNPVPDTGLNLWIAKSSQALSNFLNTGYQRWFSKEIDYVVFDIETYLGIPTCISFSFDGVEACVVPILDWNIDLSTRTLMLNSVAKFLKSPIPKVNQNIKFDWKKLERYGLQVTNIVGDTMLAASCIYAEFPKDLGFLNSIYTDLPYHKDEGKEYNPKTDKRDQFYMYCAKDSITTNRIYTKQLNDLVEQGSQFVYQELIRCLPIFKRMEDTGILIDTEKREMLQAKYESRYRIERIKLQQLVDNRNLNPLSSTQIQELVYKHLGFKPLKSVVKLDLDYEVGSAGEEELENLYAFGSSTLKSEADQRGAKEALKIIINCRKLHKVVELTQLPLYPGNRFRGEWNLGGTENGRTSTSKTTDEMLIFNDKGKVVLKKLGYAMQNIGKHGFSIDGVDYGRDVRSMFIADDGYTFVELDLSQAEARVDAVLASNVEILKVFDGPVGIHRLTGSWVYGVPPETIKKDTLVDGVDRYTMSKSIRHAGERNMNPPRLVLMTQRPLSECRQVLETFHRFQPEIRQVFHLGIRKAINETRRLVAPNGRCRDFFGRIDEHLYNEAISFLPQAIVGDQMKFSFPAAFGPEGFARSYSHLVYESHDGCMALVRCKKETEYIEQFKKLLERPIDFSTCTLRRDYKLIIPSEASVGFIWDQLKEVK